MKTLSFKLLAICCFFIQTIAFSQQIGSHYPARQGGFWNVGINGAWAYQSSDVQIDAKGFGAGFTIGKNLFYRPKAAFSFDARGRFLYAESFGLSGYKDKNIAYNNAINGVGRSFDAVKLNYTKPQSIGFYYANYKNTMGTLDLEGVLRFNRLRERTGVVVSLFGGIGLDWYKAQINQKIGNDLYAAKYLTVDSSNSRSARMQLRSILDNEYETIADGNKLDGTLTWMPTAGLELGYQFAPRFHASVFHKINFSRTDALDGVQFTEFNDWQHYTGLKLEWELGRDKTTGDAPRIEILAPEANPYYTQKSTVRVSAKVTNVRNSMDIQYRLNNAPYDFNFYSPRLNSDVALRPGRNEVEIEATNEFGSDRKTIVIIYEEPKTPAQPAPTNTQPAPTQPQPPVIVNVPPTQQQPRPMVTITNPTRSGQTVSLENFNVNATIVNVETDRDVRFFVNGKERNFNFNPRSGTFYATIVLNEGKNTIGIEARNNTDNDDAETTIYYEMPEPTPTVRIVNPSNDYFETENQNIKIRATTTNVREKRAVRFSVNGYERDFSFDSYNGEVSADIALNEGNNRIEISVSNRKGDDKDEATIVLKKRYTPPPVPTPTVERPEVRITSPSDGENLSVNQVNMEGTARYVSDKKELRLYVNDVRTDFIYNSLAKRVTATIGLKEGANVIILRADNSAGNNSATTTVYYKPRIVAKAPNVYINTPSNNSMTDKNVTNLRATVSNISERSQITLNLNGSTVSDFSFDGQKIMSNLSLQEGANTVTIRVQNEGGNDDASVNVTYKKYVAPAPPSSTTGRVPNKNNPDTPPPSTGGTTGRTPRLPKVDAPETDAPSSTTTGRVPSAKPSIDITSVAQSAGSPQKPASGACAMIATIKGAGAMSDITFKLNGVNTPFDFDVKTGQFSADFTLTKGENTILLRATNRAGSAEETRKVTY